MSSTHPALFDDDLPPMRADRTLVIRPTATRPLNKQERAFNRALTKVQMLRVHLEEEKRRLDQALVFHAAEVRPRVERAVGLRAQLVRAIAPFLDDRRLKPGDRTVLRAILIRQRLYKRTSTRCGRAWPRCSTSSASMWTFQSCART